MQFSYLCAKPKPRWGPQSYLRLFVATSTVALFIAQQLAVLFLLPLWPLLHNWSESMFSFFQVCEAEGVMIAIQKTRTNTQAQNTCMCELMWCTECAQTFTQSIQPCKYAHAHTLTFMCADVYKQEHPQWEKRLIEQLCLALTCDLNVNLDLRSSWSLLV